MAREKRAIIVTRQTIPRPSVPLTSTHPPWRLNPSRPPYDLLILGPKCNILFVVNENGQKPPTMPGVAKTLA